MSKNESRLDVVQATLKDAGVDFGEITERTFPGELWVIVHVDPESLVLAQTLAGTIEAELGRKFPTNSTDETYAVTFRPNKVTEEKTDERSRGKLASPQVDQLIQLLEARSRTSDALPSLQYVEDPRASVAAVAASRHHLVYGRRGVGKTALLLESRRLAERSGHLVAWSNAHVIRHLDAANAAGSLMLSVLGAIRGSGGSSTGKTFDSAQRLVEELQLSRQAGSLTEDVLGALLPRLNELFRSILRPGLRRLYLYIDDFYLLPIDIQPSVLDFLAATLRDCDGWLKVASIERLTRPWEPSSRIGLEVPHDASVIDLDVTLEDPNAAQHFLESVMTKYTVASGVRSPSAIAKPEALGRLVLASGGVPRDYMNLFAASIVRARSARELAREVGKEDVATAAGEAARGKKRDLEQDVSSRSTQHLLGGLEWLSREVKAKGYTYFLINLSQRGYGEYESFGQLVDLRFAHLVQAALSDQHRPGVRYEAYVLALSEFADIRLKRGLNVLDLEDGEWTWRLSGKAQTQQRLSGTQLRDRLRQAPVIDLEGWPES